MFTGLPQSLKLQRHLTELILFVFYVHDKPESSTSFFLRRFQGRKFDLNFGLFLKWFEVVFTASSFVINSVC